MGDKSKIEWTEASWNPVLGCSKVSPGCQNCYAVPTSFRNEAMHSKDYVGLTVKHPNGLRDWSGKVVCLEDRLEIPLRWKRPRKIFVNSMSDLFHEKVHFDFIDQCYAIMLVCDWHIFQLLTKRPGRAKFYWAHQDLRMKRIYQVMEWMYEQKIIPAHLADKAIERKVDILPNVWLGTSVENQTTADERIPHLLQTPAAVRWLSCEPLLGPVDIDKYTMVDCINGVRGRGISGHQPINRYNQHFVAEKLPELHWLVCGGESGPKARPMHPDWARSLRDQCKQANVPFFFKQWGEWLPWDSRYGTTTPETMADLAHSGGARGLHRFHPQKGLAQYPIEFKTREEKDTYFSESILMNRVSKKKAGRLLDNQEHNEYPV